MLLTSNDTYMMHSAELGWTVRPSSRAGIYRANAAGLRAGREYAPRPAPGILRVAAFGDSFVNGVDVPEEETWASVISAREPDIEVLNYGIGAYGVDQALLRYRLEGGRFKPQVVLIGFMAATLHRNIMTFRPYWDPAGGMPFAKPRFILKDEKLVLIPNPLSKLADYKALLESPETWEAPLGAHDWFYQRAHGGPDAPKDRGPEYDPSSEGFKVLVGLLDAFSAEVRRDERIPLIVLFPHRSILEGRRAGKNPYKILLDALRARGLDFLDCTDALAASKIPAADLFGPSNHLSAAGNRLVAEAVVARLREIGSSGTAP